MRRHSILALCAAAVLTLAAPTMASARGGFHGGGFHGGGFHGGGFHGGGWHGGGWHGGGWHRGGWGWGAGALGIGLGLGLAGAYPYGYAASPYDSYAYDGCYLTRQRGMFSYTCLGEKRVARLRERHAVYLTDDGRMNIAGLNDGNLERVAEALAEVAET